MKISHFAFLVFIFQSGLSYGQQCVDLFKTHEPVVSLNKIISQEHGVTIYQNINSIELAKLFLHQSKTETSDSAAAIKIIRQGILNSSFALTEKNFIGKDEIVLGYQLKNEYSLEVTYVSDSRLKDKFVIDEIAVLSPTGYKTKVAEKLFKTDRYELKTNEFKIDKSLDPGTEVNASIPFFIEGKTLEALGKYATSFELFTKAELRELFSGSSQNKIDRQIFIRKAKNIFYKVLVKEPFKIVIGVIATFSVMTIQQRMEFKKIESPEQIEQVVVSKDSVLFEHAVKKEDGSQIIYKVYAKEDTLNKRIDYVVEATK